MNDNIAIINRLIKITDISSPYAQINEENFDSNRKEMGNELINIENAIENWTPILHEKIAIAYRNYCAWYVRGDERKEVLLKVVSHLEKSIEMDPYNATSKTELSHLLVEEKQIRNLGKALQIIDDLNKSNQLPAWMNSTVEKAKRWSGKIDIPINTNFKELDPSPAVFREERIKLRKLLSELQREKSDKAIIIAKRLYNLGIYVTKLYGSHDCNSGVMGIMHNNAVKQAKKIGNSLSYEYLGRIKDCLFLTEQDYKKIEKEYGIKTEIIDINDLK